MLCSNNFFKAYFTFQFILFPFLLNWNTLALTSLYEAHVQKNKNLKNYLKSLKSILSLHFPAPGSIFKTHMCRLQFCHVGRTSCIFPFGQRLSGNSFSDSLFKPQINCASLSRMSCTAWLPCLQTGRNSCPSELLWHRTHSSMHLCPWINSCLPRSQGCAQLLPQHTRGRECQASGRRKRSAIPSALLPKQCSLNCVIKQIISTRCWEFFYSNWATAVELQDPAKPGRAG